jgi:catechol 2,3-dioxygenase-like lactoylglutathione lyase family enzyme
LARINGVHHVSMSVPSLEAALVFYKGWLGFEEVMSFAWRDSPSMDQVTGLRGSAGRMAFLSAGNLFLEIFEYEAPRSEQPDGDPQPNRRGYTHLCLDVDDALGLHAELAARGMRFISEPIVSDSVRTVYGRDPFGNIIELQQILKDVPSPL